MPIIKQLPYHEAQKIAAGEVVERPANIVKELIENALDAQCTQLTLYIEDGGKNLIRIVDNGCGMDYEDAQLCFAKHATSKINHVHELESISTFGFRGEALASISAISDVKLITKQASDTTATEIVVSHGTISKIDYTAGNLGTDITIHNIFDSVPARKKFLKSRETEWRHILQLVHATSLAHPHLQIKLIADGKIMLHCQATEKLINRAHDIFEQTSNTQLLEIKNQDDKHKYMISGIASNHIYGRFDRNQIYFFVNNRWVKNYRLSQALLKGYNNVLPAGKYPIAALAITIPAHELDINIHPRKEEVQFMHPRIVEKLIETSIRHALEQHISHTIQKPISITPAYKPTYKPESFSSHFVPYNFETTPEPEPRIIIEKQEQLIPETHTQVSTLIKQHQVTIDEHEHIHIIGQLDKTYILTENKNNLFVIDQHAAHERILYERFRSRFEDAATVNLLFPITITLSPAEIAHIQEYFPLFQSLGVTIEQFAQDQLIISATPVHAQRIAYDELIKQTISWLSEHEQLSPETLQKKLNEHVHAQMACKAAIKAGDELTQDTMRTLIDDLYQTPNRFSCPHGRPTGWELSISDIEKKFKRRL